jgi:hypothetical protein
LPSNANWALGMKVLSCFALKLGFTPDFFTECHDPLSSEYQSTLRLLHYLPMIDAKPEDFTGWRAGAHTDFDCLTLLRLNRRRTSTQSRHVQYRRHGNALERRQASVDTAPRAVPRSGPAEAACVHRAHKESLGRQ